MTSTGYETRSVSAPHWFLCCVFCIVTVSGLFWPGTFRDRRATAVALLPCRSNLPKEHMRGHKPNPTCSASTPSSTALATSVASARVGRGAATTARGIVRCMLFDCACGVQCLKKLINQTLPPWPASQPPYQATFQTQKNSLESTNMLIATGLPTRLAASTSAFWSGHSFSGGTSRPSAPLGFGVWLH